MQATQSLRNFKPVYRIIHSAIARRRVAIMFGSIRSRLLGLVLATVVPFLALIGAGLWIQWRSDQAAALQRALNDARLIAGQVDDHIGNLESLLTGVSRAVSTDPPDIARNDALLRRVKAEQPDFVSNILLFALDGTNIGRSRRGSGGFRLPTEPTSGESSPVSGSRSAMSYVRAPAGNGWLRLRGRSKTMQVACAPSSARAPGSRVSRTRSGLKGCLPAVL